MKRTVLGCKDLSSQYCVRVGGINGGVLSRHTGVEAITHLREARNE
jgi:hypothetical protein